MNSENALNFVQSLADAGRLRRLSSTARATNAIVFKTQSDRVFAVEINDTKSRGYAHQVKLVCESRPAGAELPWAQVTSILASEPTDRQFQSSAYKFKGSRIYPGQQMSVFVETQQELEKFLNWYSEVQALRSVEGGLSRREIEAAMDAYDSFRTDEAHREIFSAFGEPRDYWVRSSRDRENRVYLTNPLFGFILGKTELNGGWGHKADAAARLHNVGFIVVDQNDQPIGRPERYEHLMEGADRIRLCALNYFIEPAREKAARKVSIRAGDLAAAIGLKDAFPNICQALGGEKFQNLAQVPPPTSTEPNPSSSTVFTYTLNCQAETYTVTDTKNAASPSAVNLILYGPRGTGKTYQTAWEAVRLCVGAEAAAELKDDRDALTAEYRRLTKEGRIEFLTFHQSSSYEEFVEGLRPSTGDDDLDGRDETAGGTGFRLKCHEGIFKRISERARLDQGESGGTQRLDRSARVFKVALGRRHVEDERIRYGLDNDLIHLG